MATQNYQASTDFDAVYDVHADWLFRLCFRLCGYCHAEAEDLAQEVLVAVFQSLPRFAHQSRLTTWMYAIAIRTWRKRQSRRLPLSLPLDESVEETSNRRRRGRPAIAYEPGSGVARFTRFPA